jgi:hypothetical protein
MGPRPGRIRAGLRSDRRINREGRPRGSSKSKGVPQEYLAPDADRLKLLVVGLNIVDAWLEHLKSPFVTNLPYYDIVACRLDTRRSALVFTIRSSSFPRIARGAPIPGRADARESGCDVLVTTRAFLGDDGIVPLMPGSFSRAVAPRHLP